ncbi:MAG: CorA family divalent cation transporter [Crocinitomicaceae bacterium]|jgi:magnesium transporter
MNIAHTEFENFTWIDITQPDEIKLASLADEYSLDYYLIKDSLERGHLPKIEKLSNYTFIILRAFSKIHKGRITNVNELSNKIAFFYNDKQIITIHRANFDFIKEITNENQFINSEQFLLYLIKKMIETYSESALELSDKIDRIEQVIFLKDYRKVSLEDLYFQKSQTRISKKILQLTQHVMQEMDVFEDNKTAIQDIKDQLISLVLTFDEVMDDSNNLLNMYLSVNAQKTNDVMKLLTIFSAFFLPLTFIVGIYGMNFKHMPELEGSYSYYIVLVLMAILSFIIFYWFRKKNIL